MRLVRNLSVGAKLSLSVGLALIMLAALGLSARASLRQLASLQDRAALAAQNVQRLGDAQRAGDELRVLGREIAVQESLSGLNDLLDRAKAQVSEAKDALAAAGEAESTAPRVASLLEAIGKEAAMRRKVLQTRDRDLFRPLPDFENALKNLGQELDTGAASAGGVAAVSGQSAPIPGTPTPGTSTPGTSTPGTSTQAAPAPGKAVLDKAQDLFTSYRMTTDRLQNAVLRFLATGNAGMANLVADSADTAAKEMADLAALPLPASILSDARMTQGFGDRMAQAAKSVIAQSRALDGFIAGDLQQQEDNLNSAIWSAASRQTDAADNARGAAVSASTAAQDHIMLIGGAIALVLIVSGWFTSRAVALPFASMARLVGKLAEGDADTAFGYAGRTDEVGRMAAALEKLRGAVRDAFVRAQIIDQLPLGVLTAASNEGALPITYLNPAGAAVLGLVRERLAAAPDSCLGSDLTHLCDAPELAEALQADAETLPRHVRLDLGEETLDVSVSAIRDRAGAMLGPMLTWRRATEQAHLVGRFEGTVGAIAQGVGARASRMTQAAEQMTGMALDAGARIEAVANASGQASGSVAAAASAAEELAASISEISRQVAESVRFASQAVQEAESTDQSVGALAQAAQRIDDVVRLIGEIAGRTNLLALNATIEAARAGEAGKGFAVVASEVKNLASQTARATQEIGAQISAMQGATTQAVEALRSICETIARMSEIATGIAGAVEEQSAATAEIAHSVQLAATSTSEVSSHIAEVKDEIGRTGEAASQVLATASELSREAESLRAESDSFLADVQKAA